jgi:hypothetical protein
VPRSLACRICGYLLKHGWTEGQSGPAGIMWIPPGHTTGIPIGAWVPPGITRGDHDWTWLVRRVSEIKLRPREEVARDLLRR